MISIDDLDELEQCWLAGIAYCGLGVCFWNVRVIKKGERRVYVHGAVAVQRLVELKLIRPILRQTPMTSTRERTQGPFEQRYQLTKGGLKLAQACEVLNALKWGRLGDGDDNRHLLR